MNSMLLIHLSPAKVISVNINENDKIANVEVDDHQIIISHR